jgi:replication initiator protein A
MSSRYFDLKKPLERRLYELARRHCWPDATSRPILLPELATLIGSRRADLRKIKADIKAISMARSLPDYDVILVGDPFSEVIQAAAAVGLKPQAMVRRNANATVQVVFRRRETATEGAGAGESEVVTVAGL